MSKTWKIILGVLLGIVVIVVVTVVGGIYFALQYFQNVAQEVYGGKLASHVRPIIALSVSEHRMAVLSDTQNGIVLVLATSPQDSKAKLPFSEPDAEMKKVFEEYKNSKEAIPQAMSQVTEGAEQGTPSSFKIGDKTVYTLLFNNSEGQPSEIGILNLDRHQLIFMASGTQSSEQLHQGISQFLTKMPTIEKDSQFSKP